MKKTILATAVPALLAASSAYATVNLYDTDGVKLDAKGATEVQYYSGLEDGSDGKFRLDDGDLQFNVSSEIANGLTAVGEMAFKFEKSNVENDTLYVGIQGDFGKITAGRQLLIADDLGISKDYEFGGKTTDFPVAGGDQVAKYTFEVGDVYGGVSALVASDGKSSTGSEARVYDGKIGYTGVSGLDVRAFLYQGRDISAKDAVVKQKIVNGVVTHVVDKAAEPAKDVNGFQLEAEYAMDAFSFAASYGRVKTEDSVKTATSKDETVDTVSLAADYTQGKNTLAGGVNYAKADTMPQDAEQYTVYANITHKFNSNVRTYFEIAVADGEDKDGKDVSFETAYVAGMEVKF